MLVTCDYYPGQKKIETATQAKHRRVHSQEITRLRHVCAVVSNFFGQGSICIAEKPGCT